MQGFTQQKVIRHNGEKISWEEDFIVKEVPVALVYNGISHAVMMATPCDIKEFAIGFSITEGIVEEINDIYDINIIDHEASFEVAMIISQQAFHELKSKRRSMMGRSGCGVCGIESIELLELNPQPITRVLPKPIISTHIIEKSSQELLLHQFLMAKTGGAHAGAWCNIKNGEVLKVFEDVGRHNALDKLVGYLALNKIDISNGFVFMSSRGSYELVRKVARMNINLLATISAPTSLAIEIARKSQVRLISFCRNNKFTEY